MSDERVRELERRWRVTGLLDDRIAFLRERLRLLGRGADRLRLAVHDYDAAATHAAVAGFVEGQLPALAAAYQAALEAQDGEQQQGARKRPDPPRDDGWKHASVAALNRFLSERLGPWFEGLGGGFGMEGWCLCHAYFGHRQAPVEAGLSVCVDRILKHVDHVHRFHALLLATFDEIDLSGDDPAWFAASMADAMRRLVELVVRETGCDDAWYAKPHRALALLIDDKGLAVPEAALDGLDETFSGTFESWVAPTDEQVALVADAVSLALARALFEERYGEP